MVRYSCYLQVRGFGGVTRVRERKADDNIRRTDTGNDTRTRRSCRKRKMGRSEVIMEATQQFLQEKRARELRDEMERGYAEMATINFAIACECTHVEAEAEDRNISILGG